MALGILGSMLLYGKLKELMARSPSVDFVDFKDGLLAVRSKKQLTIQNTTVKLKASFGTVLAAVVVESYDQTQEVYRLQLLDSELLWANLDDTERREATRLPRALELSSAAFLGGSGTTEDISVTGARVASSSALEAGETIGITVHFEDQATAPISVDALVKWSAQKMDQSYHAGLQFLNLSGAQKDTLHCFIDDHLALEERLHELDMQ